MSTIDDLARDFLAQERFAVAGVSRTREDAANTIYRALKAKGKRVYALNPQATEVLGDKAYPDLAALPEKPDVLVIVTKADSAESLVQQCLAAGVQRVWMHNMLGTSPRFGKNMAQTMGSVSDSAVRLCRENGIAVIPGSCPMQFLGDFGHSCMRVSLRLVGALHIPTA